MVAKSAGGIYNIVMIPKIDDDQSIEMHAKKTINKCLVEIKKKNNRYIDILYYLIGHKLRCIALKYLRNEYDASDLVQDFWANIYEYADKFKYIENGYSYLCRIMTCMSINRYNQIHVQMKRAVEYTDAIVNEPLDENAIIEKLNLKKAVQKALDKLKPIERVIIQLVVHEGLTIEQISAELQLPKSTVGRIKLSAEEKLKKALSDKM